MAAQLGLMLCRHSPVKVEIDRLVGHDRRSLARCTALCRTMSSPFGSACQKIDLAAPLTIARTRHHVLPASFERCSFKRQQIPTTGDNVTNAPTAGNRSPDDTDKQDVLNQIGTKWSRFSKQELSALTSNDDLVDQIVAKYGLEKGAAQSQVDALMDGRSLKA
jgi:hypothetical protein